MGDVAISGRLAGTTLNNGIETLQRAVVSPEGGVHVYDATRRAGERNENSPTGSYMLSIPAGNATRCDIDTTETLVTASPCIVLMVTGNDGNTGYTDLIDANATGGASTPKFRINCGDGANPQPIYARFENGLCVDGESAGHDVTVVWWPL